MLARALLGIEKTDRNRCTGLYKLYVLHPANVRPQLASSRSCEGAEKHGSYSSNDFDEVCLFQLCGKASYIYFRTA
jgi:hypothetical protein